jgi:hypothetical protein
MRTASEDRDWPGTTPKVPGDGDFEEVLRRALRSAADGLEPTGDGLTQIFRRVAAPWLVRQVWLLATDCVDLLRLITIWLQPMFAWARAVLAAVGGSVHEALRRLTSQAHAAAPISAGQHRRGQARASVFWGRSPALKARARAAVAWLRPAVPVALTATVVMTGGVALSQTIARIELSGNRDAGTSARAGAAPATGDHRQSPQSDRTGPSPAQITPARPGTAPASSGGAPHQHSCAATRCPPSPAGMPPSEPATTPFAQLTTSPSPSPAPTPTPTRSHHQPHPHPTHHPHPPHPGPAETPVANHAA